MGASIVLVLGFAVFFFSCIAVELIARNPALRMDASTAQIIDDSFGSFFRILVTIFQFITSDGAIDIYRPIILVRPELTFYFAAVVFVISILFMSLVTAVLVDDAVSRSKRDEKVTQESMRKEIPKMVRQIQTAFRSLDEQKSGAISLEELLSANLHKDPQYSKVRHILKPDILADLYGCLDANGSGTITEDELVISVMQLAVSESSLDMAEVKHLIRSSLRQIRQMKASFDKLGTDDRARRQSVCSEELS